MIGKTISHYKILEKLGAGGMGVVYKAEDTRLERIVALKFLPPELSRDEEAKSRFIREAKTASALQDNNICAIHDIEETNEGQLFIVMDCYEGESLKDLISREPVDIEKALNITSQVLNGLCKAHEKGIVHRDIKPANIFITKNDVVKILDFGLAKAAGRTQLTQFGTTVGTCNYMSPEQARGEDVDQRTDIWSLGIVMYEMLSGKLPFSADYDQAIIYSILNENPDLSKVPAEIVPILQKAITKSREERYQKTEEVISDINSLQNKTASGGNRLFAKSGIRKIKLRTKILFVSILTSVLALAAVYYFNLNKSVNTTANTPERKMIVVPPFENLGSSEDDDFALGVRDEISNKLSSLASLGVISRNSAEQYAKSNKSTKEIGKELGVDYILTGSIRWAKGKDKERRIRIIPQLVRVSDDLSIWSESFDKVINNIFDIQNEIAQNVVDQLGIKISPGLTVMGPPPTKNLEAYDYYLKALKFAYGPATGANIKTCIKLYEKAIELDPDFAEAHAQISIPYMGLFKWRWDTDSLNLKKASMHLQKAKQLKPNIAEIHLAQAFYYGWFTNDDERVFQEFKKVLVIQPNNALVLHDIRWFYLKKGENDLAKQCEIKSMQLDPLNARYPAEFANDYSLQKDYATAEKYYKRAIELSPNTSEYRVNLAFTYLDWKGNTKLAWQTVKNINNDEYLEWNENIFIYLNVLDRNFDEALNLLKSSKKEYENNGSRYIPNSQMIALIYKYIHKDECSKKYFDSSKIHLEKMLQTNPDDSRYHFALCKSYAGLGYLNKAIIEVNKGIGLVHSLDTDSSKIASKYLAIIYLLTGDYENALKKIDFLLSNETWLNVNILKLDPLYDPLRNQQGYKSIIDKYSAQIN